MARGTKSKGKRDSGVKAARAGVVGKKPMPWGTIIAVIAIVALAGVVLGYYVVKSAPKREQAEREEAAQVFTPSDANPDPSKKIEGVTIEEFKAAGHVNPSERVAYEQSPPFGGAHDGIWADCSGVVYPQGVRSENLVHSLEHGAVWIAYDPEKVSDDDKVLLEVRAEKKPFTVMSPYPGLDKPISLQSWGHQLKVDDAGDIRIDQFIAALRRNPNTTPEPDAGCTPPPGSFDVANPPPFDPSEPGKDAKPMDYGGNAGMNPDAPAGGQPLPGDDAGGEPQGE
ncbi:MAG: DUF3105 domain-containing protein [Actinophytocola sp.]|nr:DUF3105 domain-containing protein [Actinophytocola sp.]